MLTLRQLRYFEALSETLHFGQAARRLNISQPALSAQIAQLEEHFGAALFERRSTGVALTPEGERVKRRVRRILAEVRDLEALTEAHGELLVGQLRIGIIASLAPYLLPGLLAELARSYPRLTVGVRENVTAVLADELSRGDLDCVVQALPVERKGVSTIALCEDPFLLAVPEGSGDRIPVPVSPGQLENERLILLEEGHCLRDQALDVCRIVEQRDLATLGATSLTTLMRMVAGGLGVTLVPQSAVETEARAGGIRFLPFEAPVPSRHLALAFRTSSGRRSDFERLAEMIRACLGPSEGSGHDKAGDTRASPASI
ncbi:hydrogen peroxide-inducible genes activator [Aureimonas ureilytica]|uniref:hydrogen peroxide-inducible genes activator n=1 Tax=Aureimonas ureilytica TaxID=401562 RepID=UPI00037383AA|nr:hydrogen peroxide-inducible genes activator [Aureimonas ureilytica]